MNNPEVAEKSLTFKAKDNDEFSCQSTEHEPDPERTPHQEADLESNKPLAEQRSFVYIYIYVQPGPESLKPQKACERGLVF